MNSVVGSHAADQDIRCSFGLKLIVFLFLIACIFDPADLLMGLKLPLFVLAWCFCFFQVAMKPDKVRLPVELLLYLILMFLIPLVSLAVYYLSDGSEPFEGFQLIKAYAFISFGLLLYLVGLNLLGLISFALTLLSIVISVTFLLVLHDPALYLPLKIFGDLYGMVILDNRDFGSGVMISQIYFVTSPMLVISISYYYKMANISNGRRLSYFFLMGISAFSMFVAGTRNNMAVAVLLPTTLYLFYSEKRVLVMLLFAVLTGLLASVFYAEISVFLDPDEVSNSIKLSLVEDYYQVLSNPFDLLFGQGLGAYSYWAAKGFHFYITELTYFEVIRNFGLLLGAVMFLLLLYPLIHAFLLYPNYIEKHIVIGYFYYLVMCATNPNMFSSMGMLILAVIVANLFINRDSVANEEETID